MKVKSLFSSLNVSGTTPEGLCFEAIEKDLIPGNSNQDSYFVNFSDGQPYFCTKGANGFDYTGYEAASHTKRQVDNLRKKGILVSSYYVEDSDSSWYRDRFVESFKRMYGKDSQFINVGNVHEVAKTMNKKFLQKSVN